MSVAKLVFSMLAVMVFVAGCTGSPSTKVLNGKVAEDPSLGADYSGETGGDPLAAEPKQPKPAGK